MSQTYTDPKVADVAELIAAYQAVLGGAVDAAAQGDPKLATDSHLGKKLRGQVANAQLAGVFALLESAFGERCWEKTGCHEAEFKLLWALRTAIVFGGGNVRKLRGNGQRKTITEGLAQLYKGAYGVEPYFKLLDDVVRLDGATDRLATLVNELLRHKDGGSPPR